MTPIERYHDGERDYQEPDKYKFDKHEMDGVMPNGGPDCCGNCSHNRAVQEMAHPHPEQRERFWQLSCCTLRDVKITNPFWTYCRNFVYGKHPETRNRGDMPTGWIYASGLYEGYVRIPWDNKNEPRVSVPATCTICGRKTQEGIEVDHAVFLVGAGDQRGAEGAAAVQVQDQAELVVAGCRFSRAVF